MQSLQEVPERLRTELSGFQSTDIVHVDTGMSVGGKSMRTEFDVAQAAASYAQLLRSSREVVETISLEDAVTEDILITTDARHTLLRMLDDTYAHVLIVDRSANLGLCRAMMRKVAPDLLDAVAE